MIIVTKPEATEEQIDHIIERIAEWGFKTDVSRGAMRTVIGVIGDEGAIREKPVRAAAAERSLSGAVLDEALLTRAAAEASREISPLPHHGFTKRYLRDNIRVYLRRALALALERAHGLA